MKLNFYQWQKEIIEQKGDTTIKGGRQTGKSWAVAARIIKFAEENIGSKQLLIAPAGRQESYLKEKIEELLGKSYRYRRRKIKEWLPLKNGSDIFCFPVGKTGVYVEGMSSIDHLIIEEAGHIREAIYNAIIPMLIEPKKRGLGWITLLGNTKSCSLKGYFYKSFEDKNFKQFHIKTEDQPHVDKEFLKRERERLGERMYKVIYEGEFDEYSFRYFQKEILKKVITFSFWQKKDKNMRASYFLGIDPARYGKSKAAFVSSEIFNKKLKIVHAETIKESSLLDLERKTKELNEIFKYSEILIDDGGFGAGLVDILEKEFKWRLKPINNASAGKEGKILKEDLYSNALRLIEKREIEIINDEELIKALEDVEVDEEEKIIGTDLSEAFVRACWPMKEKKYKVKLV